MKPLHVFCWFMSAAIAALMPATIQTTAAHTELAKRGYYRGAIDGLIGSGSSQAIRGFQAAQGLPATGRIDPKLLKALGVSYRRA
jgi:peptidoglycan hydrolase-like protein with peptidoglycan-binding domain